MFEDDIKEVLISQQQIVDRCEEIGRQLTEDYRDDERTVVLVGILKGSFCFMAELIRHIELPITVDFIGTSSYAGTETTGDVKITKDLDSSVAGKDVVVVEDVIDTGLTIRKVKAWLLGRGAHSVRVATLLDKPSRRLVEVEAEYTGFTIGNEFVVGFGLDYDQKYRNLPFVGVLKEELY